jgi:hypothetical protein
MVRRAKSLRRWRRQERMEQSKVAAPGAGGRRGGDELEGASVPIGGGPAAQGRARASCLVSPLASTPTTSSPVTARAALARRRGSGEEDGDGSCSPGGAKVWVSAKTAPFLRHDGRRTKNTSPVYSIGWRSIEQLQCQFFTHFDIRGVGWR